MTTATVTLPRDAEVRDWVPDVGAERESNPYPQANFVYEEDRFFPGYFGGVGIGKTVALVMKSFAFAGEYPGSRQIVTEPSHGMIRDVLIPTILDHFGEREGRDFTLTRSPPFNVVFPARSLSVADSAVRSHQGSEVWLRSTGVEQRMYGPSVAQVRMDEITLGHQEEQHGILAQRCRQSGYPHQLDVTGTPKGRSWSHAFYIEKPRKGTAVYLAETKDNPHLPAHYISRLVELYGGWDTPLARQELGGAWLSMVGPVHPQFSRGTHVRSLPQPDAWKLFKRRVGGIDFGGVSPTALIAGGLDGPGRAWAYREWYKHQATLDDVVLAMGDFRSVGITRWMADPSGKKEIDFLRRQGFDVYPAPHGNDLKLRVQLVGARLNIIAGLPGSYMTESCPNLITETENLSWKRVKLPGRAEEILTDEFERGCPDHAWDAWANILADFDGTRHLKRSEAQDLGDLMSRRGA